jgi:hypothetical protein
LLALFLAAAITTAPLQQITGVGFDMPKRPDKHARYVIYIHGRIIENHGLHPHDERFGTYQYASILKALASHGLSVISEARPQDTDAQVWARRVARQVGTLIKAGVPPGHITVIGASKGAVITMLVSTLVDNPRVRYVIMSNCNDEIQQRFQPRLHGAVLSIYDEKDEFGSTCGPIFAASPTLARHDEVEVHLGIGHALLYAPYREWVDPAVAWAKVAD